MIGIRDIDIRKYLKQSFLEKYYHDGNSRVIEELGIFFGSSRVDIAVINGEMHAFEIKSEVDTLNRLSAQANAYNQVFDRLTLIVYENHLNAALIHEEIKDWSIFVVSPAKGKRAFNIDCARSGIKNSKINGYAISHLLWRDEAITLAEKHKIIFRNMSIKKEKLLHLLSEGLPVDILAKEVRTVIKTRPNWRSV